MKKTLCGLAVLTALFSTSVLAHQKGDFIVRAGIASVIPNDSSDKILGSQEELEVNSNTQIGLTLGYMITDNVSFEVLAATPFSHDISTPYGNLGDIGETKHLPPTFMFEYYFGQSDSKIRPYAGGGINYTTFFDEKINSTGANAGLSDLSLDDSWGLAVNAGVDYKINEDWFVNASVWYADIDSTATYKAGGVQQSTEVHIDPVIVMISGGYKF
ncbi:outer membrane protein OmpW [Vibrio mangrovi]|uniref:Outer membrane protein W n=1 Tax=Vibrio mangrovi TaxID=474394 RepID=A0A1Y6IRV7_9VIBR|nr:outer membrane protein OmpW [Vibrio mangrovi]MDW6001581.1 outer membrane protein OmpW [Vibrio mangrovi]SMS00394.1 Outer membrane protein W precursor [Vibrio mangrovi]